MWYHTLVLGSVLGLINFVVSRKRLSMQVLYLPKKCLRSNRFNNKSHSKDSMAYIVITYWLRLNDIFCLSKIKFDRISSFFHKCFDKKKNIVFLLIRKSIVCFRNAHPFISEKISTFKIGLRSQPYKRNFAFKIKV